MIEYMVNKGFYMLNWITRIFSKRVNLLSYFPSPAIIMSSEGEILYANSSAEKLLELPTLYNNIITDFLNVTLGTLTSQEEIGDIAKPVELISQNKYVIIKVNRLFSQERYILSLQDVTIQHNLLETIVSTQAQKVATNDNKNIFLVKMANNIKSPIHSIVGFSQAILEGLGGNINEKQEKYLKIIHKNSADLLLLLEKIINFSQIESNLYEFNYKNFDIVNTVQTLANEFRPKIEEKRLQLIVETDEIAKKTCLCDEAVIKIIVSNLIENAILACDLGSITVRLTNPSIYLLEKRGFSFDPNQIENSFILLEVIDTGNGIPEAEIDDLFNPYVQVNKSTKKNVLRSLMLAITKEFAHNLKGDIWVESELLKSSTYRVIIPTEKA